MAARTCGLGLFPPFAETSIVFRRFTRRRVSSKTICAPRSESGTPVLAYRVHASTIRLRSSAAVLSWFCLVTAISFPVAVARSAGRANAWPIVSPSLHLCGGLNFADWYDLGFSGRPAAEFAPSLHELPAPSQHVAARIGLLGGIADDVR
jgi:hypothetical protein